MHIILILYTFLKIEVRLVLTGGVHTGGQHMRGGMILPEAFGRPPPQIPALQAPRQSGGKGLGAVAVTGIGGSDAAAQLRRAAAVEVGEHHLPDAPAPEPHRPTRAANAPIPPPEAGVRRREARSAWL